MVLDRGTVRCAYNRLDLPMMSYYSVFTLLEPEPSPVVRYVGITTEAPKERLKNILGMAAYPSQSGYNSRLACWIRDLSPDKPVLCVKFQTGELNLNLAKIHYITLYEMFKPQLLNSRPHWVTKKAVKTRIAGRPSQPKEAK